MTANHREKNGQHGKEYLLSRPNEYGQQETFRGNFGGGYIRDERSRNWKRFSLVFYTLLSETNSEPAHSDARTCTGSQSKQGPRSLEPPVNIPLLSQGLYVLPVFCVGNSPLQIPPPAT